MRFLILVFDISDFNLDKFLVIKLCVIWCHREALFLLQIVIYIDFSPALWVSLVSPFQNVYSIHRQTNIRNWLQRNNLPPDSGTLIGRQFVRCHKWNEEISMAFPLLCTLLHQHYTCYLQCNVIRYHLLISVLGFLVSFYGELVHKIHIITLDSLILNRFDCH